MIESKNVERLENSKVRLSVTVAKEAAQKEYDGLLKQYSKKAHIKGFRPGKAPAAVLEQKFGDSIRVEAAQKLIEESLKTIYEEIDEKPLQYAAPELDGELEFNPGQEFKFAVTYDIFPEVDVKEAGGITVEEPQVTIGKDAIEAELKQIQEQNAIVSEKSEGTVEKDNIITINYSELDENGEEIQGSSREDYSFTVGSGYNLYKIDDDVLGMKLDEEKTFTKKYGDDVDDPSLAGETKNIKVKVTKIKEKDLPELDDELAQDVDEKYSTLDDLKKDIKKRLATNKDNQLRKVKTDALVEQLVEKNPVELPDSMVQAELNANWQNFIRQFGGDEKMVESLLGAQNNTRETLFNEWRPGAEQRLKSQIILSKLIEDREIEASDEEVDTEIKKVADQNNMSEEEVRNYYQQNQMMEYIRQDIKERKLVDRLLEENTVKKGKKVKYLDFIQSNA
ncbi:trigger factor [Salinispira pacifica]|uniref:Trigger factor n=1 Tax=Salinispira pacifica TaxID=1307761 RepID=V5WJT9_9SPIO|nr:trigger factor [Salinispira pacifica]AHC15854.1 Cell division trigger factor [Salinispira pacifica]